MTFRNISVRLDANVGGFKAGMQQAAKAVHDFDDEVTRASRSTKGAEKSTDALGRAGLVAGGALVAGFTLAVKAAMEFDKEMSTVRAVTGATADEMDQLRDAAIAAGAKTVFSAQDAASAISELGKAGVTTSEILGGALAGTLDLAAAGQLEVAEAAEIAAQAMAIFGLRGEDVSHVADLLAAGANKSLASVDGMADALKQSGLVAAQTGLSIEQTSGVLALFAQNALQGSDAGTSLKTMLQRLTPQSKEAAALMRELGIDFYDAQGRFVGIATVAAELREGLSDLSEEQRSAAMTTIFGSDAVRAATILYKAGADGVNEWTRAVNDQGAAARLAFEQTDNLAGDLEQLRGSIDTALIQSGSAANDTMRSLAQGATSLVNDFSALPGPVQAGATALTAVGGAGLLAVGAIGTMLPKVRELQAELEKMGSAGTFASRSIGTIGKVGVYGAVLGGLTIGIDALSEKLSDLLHGSNGNMWELTESLLALDAKGKVSGELARQFGGDLSGLADDLTLLNRVQLPRWMAPGAESVLGALTGAKDAEKDIKALDAALSSMVQRGDARGAKDLFIALSREAGLSESGMNELAKRLSGFRSALAEQRVTAKEAGKDNDDLAESFSGVSESAEDAIARVDEFSKSLDLLLAKSFDAEEAQDQLDKTFADLVDTAERGAAAVAEAADKEEAMAEAGRNNRAAAREAVTAITELIRVEAERGATAEELNRILATQRQRLVETMTGLGMTRAEAERYASVLNNITPEVLTTVRVDVGEALTAVERVASALSALGAVRVTAGVTYVPTSPTGRVEADGGIVRMAHFAAGGFKRENHVAQIAKAGDWRVWAEDETCSEAFIPLAARNRARAIEAEHGDTADADTSEDDERALVAVQ